MSYNNTTTKTIKKSKRGRKRIYKPTFIKKTIDNTEAMAKQLKAKATKKAKDFKVSLFDRKLHLLRAFVKVDLSKFL